MIPVEGNPHLYRDENSGAIINNDQAAYEQHLISKQKRELQKKEIDHLKDEILEIKLLLKELLN